MSIEQKGVGLRERGEGEWIVEEKERESTIEKRIGNILHAYFSTYVG